MPLSSDVFAGYGFPDFLSEKALAVALSGGPDSMALVHLLSQWLADHNGPALHAITVDHALRPESAAEARQVGEWLQGWPHVSHSVLTWEGQKPATRIQEEARAARYDLMDAYCRKAKIRFLFLAHHQDDQAETFLLRLAAGSGLDGLAGMKSLQPQGSLSLVRPFLDSPKSDLVAYCTNQGIPFVQDPSNHAERFARVRLRGSMDALEREGLSSKRIALTAKRMARARVALEEIADTSFANCTKIKNTDRIVLNKESFLSHYEEIIFRILKAIFSELSAEDEKSSLYGPRTERVEDLMKSLLQSASFRKRTLGGVMIWVDDKNDEVIFQKESPKKP